MLICFSLSATYLEVFTTVTLYVCFAKGYVLPFLSSDIQMFKFL